MMEILTVSISIKPSQALNANNPNWRTVKCQNRFLSGWTHSYWT